MDYHFTKNTKLNMMTVSIKEAEAYTNWIFSKNHKDYKKDLPHFDRNLVSIKNKMKKYSLNIPRIAMPVIEPKDMNKFEKDINKGIIDIFAPYIPGKSIFPEHYYSTVEKKYGTNIKNLHKLHPLIKYVPANTLKPLQNQIWLDKVDGYLIQWGVPKGGSPTVTSTIIVSKEKYILDGHHRWAEVMLSKPSLKMKIFYIPINLKQLLELTKVYGEAIGNKPNA